MKGKSFLALMIMLIILAVIVASLNSCYTEKKAIKQVDKAIVYYPVPASQEFRRFFPIVTTGQSFSTDSAGYKASLDSLYNSKAWYESLIRGLETLPPHPVEQDTICPELSKALIQAKKEIEYQEQYIISITDDFNNIKPIIINRVDTILDKSVAMEWEKKLQDSEREVKYVKDELKESNKQKDKWFKWTVRLGISSISLLLLLAVAAYLLFKKKTLPL